MWVQILPGYIVHVFAQQSNILHYFADLLSQLLRINNIFFEGKFIGPQNICWPTKRVWLNKLSIILDPYRWVNESDSTIMAQFIIRFYYGTISGPFVYLLVHLTHSASNFLFHAVIMIIIIRWTNIWLARGWETQWEMWWLPVVQVVTAAN